MSTERYTDVECDRVRAFALCDKGHQPARASVRLRELMRIPCEREGEPDASAYRLMGVLKPASGTHAAPVKSHRIRGIFKVAWILRAVSKSCRKTWNRWPSSELMRLHCCLGLAINSVLNLRIPACSLDRIPRIDRGRVETTSVDGLESHWRVLNRPGLFRGVRTRLFASFRRVEVRLKLRGLGLHQELLLEMT